MDMDPTSKKPGAVAPISSFADQYPVPVNIGQTGGRRGSIPISFVTGTLSMIPAGAVPNEHTEIKISEQGFEEDLEWLTDKSTVLIRKLPQDIEDYINVPNKYLLQNSSGDTLCRILETTDGVTRRLFRGNQPFTMQVLSSRDDSICELIGDPGTGGVGAFVQLKAHSSSILGKVVQVNPLLACNCSPKYRVQNEKGETVSKIVGLKGCMLSDNFKVYSQQKHTKSNAQGLIGTISCGQMDMYTLGFRDGQMDNLQKVLLIAAVILLDFQYFTDKGSPHLWKLAVFCCCCIIVIVVALLVAGLAVYFTGGSET